MKFVRGVLVKYVCFVGDVSYGVVIDVGGLVW